VDVGELSKTRIDSVRHLLIAKQLLNHLPRRFNPVASAARKNRLQRTCRNLRNLLQLERLSREF
jgi:hypothetical protein